MIEIDTYTIENDSKIVYDDKLDIHSESPEALSSSSSSSSSSSTNKTEKPVGRWHLLPIDITEKILNFVCDIDTFGYLLQLSKHQSIFKPSDECFRQLCEITYLGQTSKGKLRIENWKSWKQMIIYRPRLRVNGFYCLRTLYSRAPNNDNFWEPKRTQSVEIMYHRYIRFFNNGTLLYALNTTSPTDMSRQLKHGIPEDKKIYLGYYELAGRKLNIRIQLHYCTMYFELSIQDAQEDPLNGWVGRHNILHLISHSCSSIQSNTPGVEEQKVLFSNTADILNQFVFWRQWYWG